MLGCCWVVLRDWDWVARCHTSIVYISSDGFVPDLLAARANRTHRLWLGPVDGRACCHWQAARSGFSLSSAGLLISITLSPGIVALLIPSIDSDDILTSLWVKVFHAGSQVTQVNRQRSGFMAALFLCAGSWGHCLTSPQGGRGCILDAAHHLERKAGGDCPRRYQFKRRRK